MLLIDHISKRSSHAVIAMTQPDGFARVYMTADDLPLLLELSSAAAGSGS